MNWIAAGLYLVAYLSAVVDGLRADAGNYPAPPGPMPWRLWIRLHPWILIGAAAGVVATALVALE